MVSTSTIDLFSIAGVNFNRSNGLWEFIKDVTSNISGQVKEEKVENSANTTTSSKKKKKKNKQNKQNKHIRWGEIHELYFERSIGVDSIPSSGGYPLGLGNFLEEDHFKIDDKIEPNSSESNSSDTIPAPILCSPCQCLNDTDRIHLLPSHLPTFISDINNDISHIQKSRSVVGCSCKLIKIDKLSVTGLKKEIITHRELLGELNTDEFIDKINGTELKKNDLINIYKTHIKDQIFVCNSSTCECLKNEVECSNSCQCCQREHHNNERHSCSNLNGKNVYSLFEVNEYRKKILHNLVDGVYVEGSNPDPIPNDLTTSIPPPPTNSPPSPPTSSPPISSPSSSRKKNNKKNSSKK